MGLGPEKFLEKFEHYYCFLGAIFFKQIALPLLLKYGTSKIAVLIKQPAIKENEINFSGRKVLAMGLGVQSGGVEAIKFLWHRGARLTVTDIRSRRDLLESVLQLKKYRGIRYCFGKHLRSDIRLADYVLKNPGVPPHSPYIRYARRRGVPILTDIGIFFKLCPAQIIGVTGTRGKSTAAYLIWKFLRASTKISGKAYLAGNIGSSVFSILPKLNKKDVVVLELSSFQLEDLSPQKISPHISVITNIYQDHLNWHGGLKKYILAKQTVIRYQNPEDYAFVNMRDRNVRAMIRGIRSSAVSAVLSKKFKKIVGKNIGAHYYQTVALALAVGKHFGVPARRMLEILHKFRGLPGRQELIGTIRGVYLVNDTTATIPDATMAAIRRFFAAKRSNANLILIAGGTDKKLDFKELAVEILKNVDFLVLLPGDATKKLEKALSLKYKVLRMPKLIIRYAKTMREAVNTAWRLSRKGDWIILSPGAASFGLFLNEFDRGKQFIREVNQVK